uniref:Syndetin n=1 Tax=Kalanchoe fedtschenkoi TaxID=63787 RepID=A0A7N0U890_KALFE
MQQPNLFPFATPLLLFNVGGNLSTEGIPRPLFLPSFFLFQGGGMDLSKVGEKILSSVRSARSLGLLPPASDRPEVPARAAAAAAVARALASLPPHQRFNLSSSSEELSSIYGSKHPGEVVEELEEAFYEEEFDPVRHVIEHIPSDENELTYFEKQATVRLAQLDKVAERLSKHVMNHHEVMVKGMHLVREVEKDLKVANVICMNGRRHLNASRNEVSRDLIVNTYSKRKQAFQDMLPILNELRNALAMQTALEALVEEGNYCKAFQVLSEYLQLLDSFSQLSVIQEMSRGVEVWLAKTLQKLDSLLMRVCQEFEVEAYMTVIDAYALIGDVSGLAEKIQSFFMQEILSETHSVLKSIVEEDCGHHLQISRYTYSDLCGQIPESKFRVCLLKTLAAVYKLICSYFAIMSFQPEDEIEAASGISSSLPEVQTDDSIKNSTNVPVSSNGFFTESESVALNEEISANESRQSSHICASKSTSADSHDPSSEMSDSAATSGSSSPWYQLRKDAAAFVSQTLQRGRKNLWQLTTSRLFVLLSSSAVCSTSIHQFLKNSEDLNIFILAGEAFCGHEVSEFRQKLKNVCENYYAAFHRQNIYALKMVLEKESWMRLPIETIQVISFAGLVGDGAPLIVAKYANSAKAGVGVHHSKKSAESLKIGEKNSGFSHWLKSGNPFLSKVTSGFKESGSPKLNGSTSLESGGKVNDILLSGNSSPSGAKENSKGDSGSFGEDENEDLLADFIDEDSQLPSRVAKPKSRSMLSNNEDTSAQTGSSLCLLRLMDKYARLMQKLEVANIEFFKGICQLFGIFFFTIYDTFVQQNNSNGKGVTDYVNYRLKTALSRINQDCDQWIRPQLSSSSPTTLNSTFGPMDITPVSPPSTSMGHMPSTSFGLKERCAAADSISQVAQILHRAKPHLQSLLLQNNATAVEDFYVQVVNSVPDLTEHLHRSTARLLLHINGYADRIASAKWELKELGLEHNGYVDLLLGEFKHYRTRLLHGGINKETQDLLLEYGLENVAETLVEGLSRIKRCTDEGRALMSLDLQVLINGLQHFAPANVRPKFQIVEAFIKAYYLPETEFVHWARAHPEYTKNQVVGLINLVATMKSWKRKTRLEVLEKIE